MANLLKVLDEPVNGAVLGALKTLLLLSVALVATDSEALIQVSIVTIDTICIQTCDLREQDQGSTGNRSQFPTSGS